MHLAGFADVVVASENLEFFRRGHGPGFIRRPGEVVAVIVQSHVGVL